MLSKQWWLFEVVCNASVGKGSYKCSYHGKSSPFFLRSSAIDDIDTRREDLLSSCVLNTRPIFAPGPCSALIDDTLLFPNVLPHLEDPRCLSRRMLEIFYDMRSLTRTISQHPSILWGAPDADTRACNRLRYSIKHRLHTFPIRSSDTDELQATDYVYEEHRLAALIYVNLVFCGYSPGSDILNALKHNLIAIIQQAETCAPHLRHRPLSATWVLFLGGIVAAGDVELAWFVERIARSTKAANLNNWEDVKSTFWHLAWTDELDTPVCMRLWDNVVAVRAGGMVRQPPVLQRNRTPDVDQRFVKGDKVYMGVSDVAINVCT